MSPQALPKLMWSPSWSALLGSLWAVVGGPLGVALSRSPQSLPMKKRLCSFFYSLVVAMVDTTRDAFDNIGTSLKDVVGTVVSARDALEIMGTFTKMSTVQ